MPASAERPGVAPFDQATGAFRATVRRFVAREIAPRVERWERAPAFPRAAIQACGRRGYLSLDPARMAVLAEELVRCDSMGVSLAVFVQAGLIGPLLDRLASAAQRSRYLEPLRAGRLMGAMAVTEPGAGSDIAAIGSIATIRRGRTPVLELEGEKTYITCGAAADFLIVAARVVDGTADRDPSLLLVPTDARGVRITPLDSLGLRTTAMARIVLRNCRLPLDAILGERGGGYGYVLEALDRERLYGALGAVAWAQRALDRTAAHLRGRRAFGRALNRHQAIRHQFADASTALAAARYLTYAAWEQWRAGRHGQAMHHIAMVKLFSYREAQRVIELCLQLHGGRGYMDDHWTSRWYRDARALTIAAGTPEVMRELIAAQLRL